MSLKFLEHRIPPPIVAAIIAIAMWQLAPLTLSLEVPNWFRWITAASVALIGIAFDIGGILSFRRARTTINPLKPDKTSSLVSSGLYRFSRNPMYVGMLLLLIAWSIFLAAPLTLLGPLAFLLYMGRFQIAPEERAMSKRFGTEFDSYTAKVRRWL